MQVNTLNDIIKAINTGQLSFEQNLFVDYQEVPDTGPAGSVITINHNLQHIPTFYIWNINRAGTVYDFLRSSWTAAQITLSCSIDHASLNLIIL